MGHGTIRIGLSGWTYPPWRGAFYPEGLRQKDELAFASRVFNALEINGTFYGLQTPETYARWAAETPDDFVFAVKGPRFITHVKRLSEPIAPLANFLASGVLRLGTKLGPILWQFPPNFAFDYALMAEFLALLPHSPDDAERLARQHDGRMKARAWLRADQCPTLRHAVEIRHPSFVDAQFMALLRRYDIALVCADTVTWPRLMDLTSDFAYCRLHGSDELYRSGYSDQALDLWAARAESWAKGRHAPEASFVAGEERRPPPRDVFVFFDNTDKQRAPEDARGLMQRLGQKPGTADHLVAARKHRR